MTDILSIATFAADQLSYTDGVSLDMTIEFSIAGPDAWLIEITDFDEILPEVATVNRTAAIIAEMREANDDALNTFENRMQARAEKADMGCVLPSPLPRIRPALSTTTGRNDAARTAGIILQGTAIGNRNAERRDLSLPKRALSMCSSRGRATPDMAASLMAFFSSPGNMAEHLLASFLPSKVSTAQAKALLDDTYVVDVIEGLGHSVPTPKEAVALVKNPCTGHAGGAPGRVHVYTPGVAPTVDAKRRGRPSGVKQVASLTFGQGHSRAYVSDALVDGRIPGGNDVMQGPNAARRMA